MNPLRMGTRASALARAQSSAAAALLTAGTGRAVETVIVRTQGDQLSMEGKAPPGGDEAGVFTRALDDALRRGEIDFAIHSLKDVPTTIPEELVLAAVPRRADARDALIVASRHSDARSMETLPRGARVATSSPRRVAQILRIRPDVVTVAMAGNVDTRLARLEEGRADALLLACAGLDRLGKSSVITRRLEPEEMLGAPAQGALALVCRADDEETKNLLKTQDDFPSRAAVEAERELLQFLRGGCRAPVGARGFLEGEETLRLMGRVLSLDGNEVLEDEMSVTIPGVPSSLSKKNPLSPPLSLGRALAERLLSRGAARLIDAARTAENARIVPP